MRIGIVIRALALNFGLLSASFVSVPTIALAQQGVVGVPPFSGCATWSATNILTGTGVACGTSGSIIPGTTIFVCPDIGNVAFSQGPAVGAKLECSTLTGTFFTQNGANILRINDRLFIGGATVNDGAFPNVMKDWLQTYSTAAGGGITTTDSVLAILTAPNSSAASGAVAATFGAQSLYSTSVGTATIALQLKSACNNATLATSCWPLYIENDRKVAASGPTVGIEIDTQAFVAGQASDPFRQGLAGNLQLAAGGELSPGHNADFVAQIIDNTAKFDVGFVFYSTALTVTSSKSDALIFASYGGGAAIGQSLVWKSGNAGSPGTERWRLRSIASSGTGEILLDGGSASITGADLNVGGTGANGIGLTRAVIASGSGATGFEIVAASALGGYLASDGVNYTTLQSGAFDLTLGRNGTTKVTIGTSAVQLGIASTSTVGLSLANASSAFPTTIQAGNAAAARTYTWPTNFGAAGTVLTDAAGNGTLSWAAASGGTVTSVSVTTANGVSGTVATATTTPAISLTLGAITPTSLVINGGQALSGTIMLSMEGQGLASGATGTSPGWYAQLDGDTTPRVRVGLNASDTASIAFGPGNAVRDLFIERNATATFRFGTADAAAPVAQTFTFQGVVAGTLNTAGVVATFSDSAGTGTGVSGGFNWTMHPAGSTGTSQNAAVIKAQLLSAGDLLLTASRGIGWIGGTAGVYGRVNTNITLVSSGNDVAEIQSSGFQQVKVQSIGAFTWSSATNVSSTYDLALTRGGAAILQLGPAAAAGAGVAQTLQAVGSTGATMANVAFTIAGPDTSFAGTATGGDFVGRAGNATGASGTRTGGTAYLKGGTGANAGGPILLQTAATTSLTTAVTIGIDQSSTFAGQIAVTSMTQTAAAQSGTVCYNSGTGAITYDATLGCLASASRFKDNIRPLVGALDEVMAMQAISYRYKEQNIVPGEQVGLNADVMEKVDPRLVGYDADGNLLTVRYINTIGMLVAAVQELNAKVDARTTH